MRECPIKTPVRREFEGMKDADGITIVIGSGLRGCSENDRATNRALYANGNKNMGISNPSQKLRIGATKDSTERRRENRRAAAIFRAARADPETTVGEYYYPEFYAAERHRRAVAYLNRFIESRGQANMPPGFLRDAEYARCASFGRKSHWTPLTPVGKLEVNFGEIDAVALDWWRLKLHPSQRRVLAKLPS